MDGEGGRCDGKVFDGEVCEGKSIKGARAQMSTTTDGNRSALATMRPIATPLPPMLGSFTLPPRTPCQRMDPKDAPRPAHSSSVALFSHPSCDMARGGTMHVGRQPHMERWCVPKDVRALVTRRIQGVACSCRRARGNGACGSEVGRDALDARTLASWVVARQHSRGCMALTVV